MEKDKIEFFVLKGTEEERDITKKMVLSIQLKLSTSYIQQKVVQIVIYQNL